MEAEVCLEGAHTLVSTLPRQVCIYKKQSKATKIYTQCHTPFSLILQQKRVQSSARSNTAVIQACAVLPVHGHRPKWYDQFVMCGHCGYQTHLQSAQTILQNSKTYSRSLPFFFFFFFLLHSQPVHPSSAILHNAVLF